MVTFQVAFPLVTDETHVVCSANPRVQRPDFKVGEKRKHQSFACLLHCLLLLLRVFLVVCLFVLDNYSILLLSSCGVKHRGCTSVLRVGGA